MSYERINPIPQFNFQINRVLTYGELACDSREVREKTASIRTLSDWKNIWTALVGKAEREQRCLHAAYYHRMAEFFLTEDDPDKDKFYEKCIRNFYRGFDEELHLRYERHAIPFAGKTLNGIRFPVSQPKGVIVICGGYDSFMEEFVLQISPLAADRYDVILFEGPGQGRCLRKNMYFRHDFETAASAVLDYFEIPECAMIGISWGGYFALRSAAFEKRITAVIAYDVLDNGLEVMTNVYPAVVRQIIRAAYRRQNSRLLNALAERLRKRSVLADWALSQGMYITGTKTPYAFYQSLSRHSLEGVSQRITQDVLLLAGEKDHYIPLRQFYRLKENLPNAKTLTCRLFTADEGGGQHCQIGNHMLAIHTITDWLDGLWGRRRP